MLWRTRKFLSSVWVLVLSVRALVCSGLMMDDSYSWYEEAGGVIYEMPAPNIMHQLAWPHHERRCNLSTRSYWHVIIARRHQSLFGHIAWLAGGVPARDIVKLQVDLASERSRDWKRRTGRWIDHLRTDTGRIPADLWSAVQRGHGRATLLPSLASADDDYQLKLNYGKWVHLMREMGTIAKI